MEKGHGRNKAFDWEKWRNILLIGLTIILIINVSIIFFMQSKIKDVQQAAEEALRPAKIQLLTIKDKNCKECFNIDPLSSSIRENRVEITKESEFNIDDNEVKGLVAKYGITRIPALIVTGEIDKISALAGIMERRGDAYIFTQVPAPYLDVQSRKVKGIVESTLIYKKDCEKCMSLQQLLVQIKNSGIYLGRENSYDSESKEAKELISKYALKKLPVVIFSNDIGDYEQVKQNWQVVGTVESDGNYVFRKVNPPYYDIDKRGVIGLVGIVFITDKDCTKCYNVTLHKEVLNNMGIALEHESTYDISTKEGKELLEKYNITKVPTIFMSDDFGYYSQFMELWNQVGTKDIDRDINKSVYTFRATEVMGAYHDLKTGQIIEPQAQTG